MDRSAEQLIIARLVLASSHAHPSIGTEKVQRPTGEGTNHERKTSYAFLLPPSARLSESARKITVTIDRPLAHPLRVSALEVYFSSLGPTNAPEKRYEGP